MQRVQAVEPLPSEPGAPDYVGKNARLPLAIKLAYGMPNFAGAGMAIPVAIHMNIFYSDVILVPLGYIALAVALARSFDAITDPLMGWISDRTNTRWGRRRPWMFIGAPICAVAFVLLFSPPEGMTVTAAASWFTATFVLYFLFHTVYAIPHYGLGPELTLDYNERSSLFAWMEGFAVLGTMVGAAIPAVMFAIFGGQRAGFTAFAVTMASILTLLYFWQCYRIKERPDFYQRKPNPIVPGVRRVLRNRPARILLATYIVGSITGAIPGLMMPYFTTYVLKVDDPQRWLALFLATYFGSGLLLLPLWLLATRRFGKYPIYIVTAFFGMTASLSLFFIREGQIWQTFLILVWAGSVFGVRIFLGPAIQADVIDYDELYTGKRREAQYGAFWAVMVKFVVIPSAAVPLAIMAQLGYQPNVEQSETVQFAISAIFGLAPATFGLLSLLVFLPFPIRQRNHELILEGIEKHKRGESAMDPLTGKLVPPPHDRGVDEETGWFLDHFSMGELRRYLERGVNGLVTSAAVGAVVSLAISLLGFWLVLRNLGDLTQRPGLTTTAEIVVGGFGFTAFVYHLVRLRAAWQMHDAPVPTEVAKAYLEVNERLSQSRPSRATQLT
jgi:GPH family glycoside/pentoside/hexuronide:cation symporter